jgi:serine/threonine-protein kinase
VDVGAWAEGSVIRGKYRILSKVGQGGMGAVYKALHLAFDELRALKVMAPELLSDELFVKRFKHEAVITRRLQHPNAVRVDDIDEGEDGRPFIVMEYIEGRSLKKLIKDEGPLPVPRVCAIIKQVAAALGAAHGLGMVHRDIKPENIVLVETSEGEQAKVLDFGIAKVKEARLGETSGMTLTGTGVVIGTPQYMSPEQAMGKRGDELDGRSDLYSLGIVMYQMLTADLPFKADTTMEMLLAHMQEPPTPIRTLHPELQIPEPVADFTMRLLEKNRDLRPANAQALIQELDRAEKEAAPVGTTRVLRPTTVVSPEEIQAAQAAVRSGTAGAQPAAAGGVTRPPVAAEPSPAASARPAPPTPVPLPAAAPPRASRWGLWVAAAILAVGLGGGTWYFTSHRAIPEPGTQPRTAPAPEEKAPAPSGQAPASQPSGGPTPSPAATGQTAGPSQPEAASVNPVQNPSTTTQAPVKHEAPVVPRQPASKPQGGVSAAGPKETAAPRAVDEQKVKAALTQGDFFYNRGEYDNAINAYQEGLTLDPANPTLRARMDRVKKAKAAEGRVLQ